MGRRAASGLHVRSRAGVDANIREATESKMTAGSEMETAGVMGKSKETAGSEAETVVGTESGVDTEVGTDSESTVDRIRAGAGAEVSARCAIATGRGDAGADLRSTVAGTVTGDDAAVVAKVWVGSIAEMVPSAWAANARLGIGRTEMERVG